MVDRQVVDCSQPSIFSYIHSIVERADRIARELDASAKRTTCFALGWGKDARFPYKPRPHPHVLRARSARFVFRVGE